jgi:hypothetical protein
MAVEFGFRRLGFEWVVNIDRCRVWIIVGFWTGVRSFSVDCVCFGHAIQIKFPSNYISRQPIFGIVSILKLTSIPRITNNSVLPSTRVDLDSPPVTTWFPASLHAVAVSMCYLIQPRFRFLLSDYLS